jgi:protein-tyrosine-phosphatase
VAAMRRVVLICAGNICRSPLAEHLLRRALSERGVADVTVESYGLVATEGDVPVAKTLRVARVAGIDLGSHRARRFHAAALGPGDLACAMEAHQVASIRARAPRRHVVLLGSFGSWPPAEVADPEDGPDGDFDACLAQIARHVEALAAALLTGHIPTNRLRIKRCSRGSMRAEGRARSRRGFA